MNVYIQKDGISIYLFYTYMHLCTWGQISSLAQFLDWEDPLEKEIGTHSSILAWGIPWREEPGGRMSMGSQRVGLNFSQTRLKQQQQQRTKIIIMLNMQ